jgi:indolepyruvate ferredoxin oxidoreductase beta subunit
MHGVARLLDYQDAPYASEYLDRVSPFAAFESDRLDAPLTEAVARGLALWMSFEDTLRVAQLKTRPARIGDIERRLRVKPGQVVEVREFLKPRVEEICGTLPASLGRRLLASPGWRRRIERFTGGRQVRTSTITGFAFLRALAGMRRWRRGTLRYAEEQARIEQWLSDVSALAHSDYDLATEVARCQPLVRGYGDTHSRGLSNHARLLDVARRMSGQPQAAGTIARLRRAANVDEQGEAFDRELAALGLG